MGTGDEIGSSSISCDKETQTLGSVMITGIAKYQQQMDTLKIILARQRIRSSS
jgi:hypothetical protein